MVRNVLLLGILFVGISITLVAIAQVGSNTVPSAPLRTLDPTRYPDSSVDPATYGLPHTIGGYYVLAVRTLENTACMLPGAKQVILQAPDPTMDEFLANVDSASIYEELSQYGTVGIGNWEVAIVGPGAVLGGGQEQLQAWNEYFADHECVKLGHLEGTLTPR